MPTAWRIVRSRLQAGIFNGEGARLFGGRWNSKGVPVIYTAGSVSLAALEVLVHMESYQLLADYLYIPVSFEGELCLELDIETLPDNWRQDPAPAELKDIGDAWVQKESSVVLRIPSAIIPEEHNFLINPVHPHFDKLTIGDPRQFRFDPRLIKSP